MFHIQSAARIEIPSTQTTDSFCFVPLCMNQSKCCLHS